ncbi:hypothetical protein RB195_023561 [Necator americanus]|uniref:Uncharacterized protein n=1 Tax=Necator americanus TaxID=51031 RepID=A0ABR1EJP9_NECAM
MTLPWTRRLVVKLVLAVLLACDSLFLLIASFIQAATDRIPFAVDIVYPLMLFLAMILHIAFMFGFRRCGKLTSGGLFMSWLLFTICGLPEMIYWLHVSWNLEDYCDLTFSQWFTHILWWPICLTELIFHCFADSPPLPWKAINEEKINMREALDGSVLRAVCLLASQSDVS